MKLKQSQIREIAQELEAGMTVFINREDLKLKSIKDSNEMFSDPDIWEEEYEKFEMDWTNYIKLETLESRESFRIMQDFVEKVDDNNLRQILNTKSPMTNFKTIVETSAYRNEWSEFNTLKHEENVKQILNLENIEYE